MTNPRFPIPPRQPAVYGQARSLQRGLVNLRNVQDLAQDRAAKVFKVSGRGKIIGDGETSVNVSFPVTFTDRPAFSYGSELAARQVDRLQGGSLPQVTAMVAAWDKVETAVSGMFLYRGASLIIVTENNPLYVFVHWHVEGMALHNPLGQGEVWAQDQ